MAGKISARGFRAHPVCSECCRESKTQIKTNRHKAGDGFLEYCCGSGTIGAVMPIIIGDRHLALFFIGQFFYADDPLDRAFLFDLAREFGSDPDYYTDEPVTQTSQRLLTQGSLTFETVHRARDGRIFPVEITFTLFEHNGIDYKLSLAQDISERKRVGQEAPTSGDYLENIINAIADPVFIKDTEHRFILVNDAFCALAKCRREELQGKIDYDFFPREQVNIFRLLVGQGLARGDPNANKELMTDAASLPPRTIATNKSRYIDPLDNRFVVGVIRDISDRKQMEEQLKASKALCRYNSNLLASILESDSSISVIALDREYRYLAFNRKHREKMNNLWGKKIAVGMSMLEAITNGENREIYRQGFDEVLTGRRCSIETKHVMLKDGRQVSEYFENHGSPVFNDDGEITGLVVFTINITERKRMEKMLRRREREFRTLVENSPDTIVRYGRDLRRLYVNSVFATLVEGRADALIGKAPSEFPANDNYAAFYEQKLKEVFASGKSLEFEMKWTPPKGCEICNMFILIPEFGEDGAVESVLSIGRDITELRRSSNILLEKQQHLADLAIELSIAEERERRRIATGLHDIVGQDLALARIKLGLLSKKLHANEDRELLEGAHKLMNGVIKSVRLLTHLINPPILQSSGLEAALQWLGRQMGEEYGLMVVFRDDHLEKPISREVQIDLYFAVRELLINVVKHAGTKRAIVSAFRENDEYNIMVKDEGVGFIMDSGIGKTADSGGFGLFNIRRRIMYFGGVMSIDSSPGNGARVTIRMPLYKVGN